MIAIRPLKGPEDARACAAMMVCSEPWLTLRFDYATTSRLFKMPPAKSMRQWSKGLRSASLS